MVAIRTLMDHERRDALLNRCEFHFYLMEKEPRNAAILRETVRQEAQHPKLKIHIEECDFSSKFKEELDTIETRGTGIAPAFVFIDPFGYWIPIDLIRRVLRFQSCEVMVTFMAQSVARATRDASKAENLNVLFGSDVWRQTLTTKSFEAQMEELVKLYQKVVGARWTTKLRLTGQTDYTLMHFTNHPEGRNTMKRSVWSVKGKYGKPGVDQLLIKDHPDQGTLITEVPDLSKFSSTFQADFYGRTFLYSQALEWLVDQDILDKHLHQILTEGRRDGWLETAHTKPFGPSIGNVPMKVVGGSLF